MPPASVSLVMAGGASLGAFHGGALAALLVGLRRPAAGGHVRIDAAGGASAGAIAALLAAHSWLEGVDPVWLMHDAWVDRLSLDLLRSRDDPAPLSFERLRDAVDEVLDPHVDGDAAHRIDPATDPMVLHADLVNLRGLSYRLPTQGDTRGTTYDDWARFHLSPSGGTAQLREPAGGAPLDAVLASAANPGAFAPVLLDRTDHAEHYRRNGIVDLPEGARFWYVDGGPLSAEPVGRVVAGAVAATADRPTGDRVALVLDPRSEGPTDADFAGDPSPSWLAGLKRTVAILPAQAISEDLRRIAKHNTRIEAVAAVAAELDDVVDPELAGRMVTALADAGVAELPPDAGIAEVLAALSGVDDKAHLRTELVSPRILDPSSGTGALLAGELLGDFGGFLDRDLRRSDFLLGWECAATWLDDRLADLVPEDVATAALADVEAARPPGDITEATTRATVRTTLPGALLPASRLLAGAAWGLIRRALRATPRPPSPG